MTFGQDLPLAGACRACSTRHEGLEVGCGAGSFAETIRNVELTCLDPSPEMLRVAKKRVDAVRAAEGEAPITYVEAIAESIPLPDASFDRVFCLFSFRDFQDKRRVGGNPSCAQTRRSIGHL